MPAVSVVPLYNFSQNYFPLFLVAYKSIMEGSMASELEELIQYHKDYAVMTRITYPKLSELALKTAENLEELKQLRELSRFKMRFRGRQEPGAIVGLLPWLFHIWSEHTPWRLGKSIDGVRIFGFEWARYEED